MPNVPYWVCYWSNGQRFDSGFESEAIARSYYATLSEPGRVIFDNPIERVELFRVGVVRLAATRNKGSSRCTMQ